MLKGSLGDCLIQFFGFPLFLFSFLCWFYAIRIALLD